MTFKQHFNLEGKHAFLSPSKYHWINYDVDKLRESYLRHAAIQRGTELHAFAKECIRLRQKLPKAEKTLNLFVNDAIKYNMIPEQVLYYSENCFGTADAISYDSLLRIHDLKTGDTPASMNQLMVYAALFCLEYNRRPETCGMELRIYQNNMVMVHNPDPTDILNIMDTIREFDEEIESLKGDN